MNPYKYQTIIKQTAVYPKEIGPAYCALGLTGEAGESAEKIKKLYRDKPDVLEGFKTGVWKGDSFYEGEAFKAALTKELGDVLWYITALANEFDIDLATVMQTNYDKLLTRRATNTLHGEGDNREDE